MFILGTKQIEIFEMDKASVQTPKVRLKSASNPNNGTLRFSALKLHIAIARCILSKDLSNLDLRFEAISSFFRYQTIINTQNSVLTLNKANIEILRDFSKKTRIGELAQGIIYLFAQDHLNYPVVVDFEGFVKQNIAAASITGKTPDFILQQQPNFSYSLIESKGHYVSSSESTKGKLKDALEQCDNGEAIINTAKSGYSLHKSFGVCVKLENETNTTKSQIQFVDPTFSESTNKLNLDIVRYHYASWFLLMGAFEIYEKLMAGELLTESNIEGGKILNFQGIDYRMFDMFDLMHFGPFWPMHYGFFGHSINGFGIRLDVLQLLMGNSSSYSFGDENRSNEPSRGDFVTFRDGTIISADR